MGFFGRDLWEVRTEMRRRREETRADEYARRHDSINVQVNTQHDVQAARRRVKLLTAGKFKSNRVNNAKATTAAKRRQLHRDAARNFLPVADAPGMKAQVDPRPPAVTNQHGYEAYYCLLL